ncbi:iron uptake porin [Anabaena cylindrica UHCC 0172]|uniref:iron uptake porin n=1 Tax=Anabaena cylindrica TaxID=1165 RepID=UPI002B2173C4|nr:iron uptake porin [Anabaena cylindrica]MEA5549567.1 iron uptake porin [Anabaena cylindrica UHCC 0172]
MLALIRLLASPMVIVGAIATSTLISSLASAQTVFTDNSSIPESTTPSSSIEHLLDSASTVNPDLDQNDSGTDESMAQINSVAQFSDVQPTDWAFQALQSLVERYGCIAGYPNATFRGNRAITRYEFAAGLNACLDRINELIATATSDLVTQPDLVSLQRLQQDFSAELVTLRGRVDSLEAKSTEIAGNQFSTTTKLFGNLRVQTNAYFSGDGNPQANMQYNLFLGLLSSFTGKDLLFTGIGATSSSFPELATNNNGRDVGSTREGSSDTTGSGDSFNSVRILGLEYQFPVGNNLLIDVVAANRYRFSPILLAKFAPYYSIGRGPVSSFAEAPPIYLVGAGSGVSASYKIVDSTVLTLTYLSTFGNDSNVGGLFNGDYVAAGQINYNPNPGLFLQLLYQHGYFGPGNFGFNNGQTFRENGFVGTALANRFDDQGVLFDEASSVITNSYQVGGYFAITPKVLIGGWANLIQARLIGKGDADIWTYSVQTAFPDLFKPGNQGGLIVGMEPTLTDVRSNLPYQQFKKDTSLHIEAYYRHQITDNLSITPSLIWITAPNQDADNEDIVIGGVRTTFNF